MFNLKYIIMKSFVYGVISLLVPMALVVFSLEFGGIITKFFGTAVMLIMIIFTHSRFTIGGEESCNNTERPFRATLIGNAATALVYLILLLLGAKVFYSDVATNPFEFPPLMLAVAYGCLLGTSFCIFRLATDKCLNGWEKAHFAFIIGAACSVGFFCVYEALRPYGAYIPDVFGNIVYAVTMLFLTGVIICGYRLTVYDKY